MVTKDFAEVIRAKMAADPALEAMVAREFEEMERDGGGGEGCGGYPW